jgi:hypothetical protein
MFALDPRVNAFINGSGLLYSRWAEVAYFLTPTQDTNVQTTIPTGGGLQLYTLRRRVRLLAPASADYYMQPAQAIAIIQACQQQYPDVISPFIAGPAPISIQQQQGQNTVILRMPGPEALNLPDLDYTPVYQGVSQTPQYVPRMPLQPRLTTGDDIVIGDVISFDVKAAWFSNANFNTPPSQINPLTGQPGIGNLGTSPPSNTMAVGNMDEPFDDLPRSKLTPAQSNPSAPPAAPPLAPNLFDTGTLRLPFVPPADPPDWDQPGAFSATAPVTAGFLTSGATTVPLRVNLRALQIKLRVWDVRAEQARQATIVVEI